MHKDDTWQYCLSSENIDEAIGTIISFLENNGVEGEEATRLRLIFEELLVAYKNKFGEECRFDLKKRKFLGRCRIQLYVESSVLDPFSSDDEDYNLLRKLGADSKSECTWDYRNRVNIITVVPRKKIRISTSIMTLVAFFLAIGVGFLCESLSESVNRNMLKGYIEPTFDTIMGIITGVAGPMIFFSLTWGVCAIGDVETLSKIGKKMVSRFMVILMSLSVFTSLVCSPIFRSVGGGVTEFKFSDLFGLILQIIPDNMIKPFMEGRTQQIIFLAFVFGIVLLILKEKVSTFTKVVGDLNEIMRYIMSLSNVLIPIMVFLGIFKIMISGNFSVVVKSWKVIAVYLAIMLLLAMAYTVCVSVKYKTKLSVLVKKAHPAAIRAFTTASSVAALSLGMESCEKSFGIDKKIIDFGMPLGNTMFKPAVQTAYVTIGFGMAQLYGVPISPYWIVVITLTCFLLSLATPPIAGGMSMCYAILFEQLGIPNEAIGIALTINVILDFTMAGINQYCLQLEMTALAGSMDMLDKDVLVKN